jgi:hypothetical protein
VGFNATAELRGINQKSALWLARCQESSAAISTTGYLSRVAVGRAAALGPDVALELVRVAQGEVGESRHPSFDRSARTRSRAAKSAGLHELRDHATPGLDLVASRV